MCHANGQGGVQHNFDNPYLMLQTSQRAQCFKVDFAPDIWIENVLGKVY
jgi:hypothetical protein